jgi:hypothetical protein
MPLLHVHVSMLHVHAPFQCCLSILHFYSPCLTFMSMLHASAAFPCASMLRVLVSCPSCMPMLPVHGMSLLLLSCRMSLLQVLVACPCCMSMLQTHATRTSLNMADEHVAWKCYMNMNMNKNIKMNRKVKLKQKSKWLWPQPWSQPAWSPTPSPKEGS